MKYFFVITSIVFNTVAFLHFLESDGDQHYYALVGWITLCAGIIIGKIENK